MTAINLQFKYTEADYNEFLWHYVTKERGRRMLLWVLLAVVGLGYTYWVQGKLNATMILSIALVFLLFAGLWRWFLLYNGRRSFAANPQMHEQRVCRVDDSGFEMQGETFTAEYQWADNFRFRETNGLFLIYTTPMSAVIFPKRAFANDQLDTFRALAAQATLGKSA